jgi:carboxyl-terminal processing protease
MRKPWRAVALSSFVSALVAGALFGERILAVSDHTKESLRAYAELLTAIHDSYGAEVSYRSLVYSSIDGMLRSLDPHTSFLTPQAYTGMRERQQESFYGLGILVGSRDGQLTVISPLAGTPASRMGLRAGDVISTIDGEPTAAMSVNEAVQKLKGPKDTEVTITIVRQGLDEPLEITITRAEIPQNTVRLAYMLTPQIGYLQLAEFSRGTGREVAQALERLKGEGMEKLILDLRNNGGGLLDQAIEVSDQFVPAGTAIVETRGRVRDSHQSYRAEGHHPELGLPLVVLVNGGTASAAEILSGAIQDHDVGLIVGTPTWGKGLVQTVYSLSYGAGLALTTAKYYTPAGRLIQRDYSSYFDYYDYDPLTGDGDEGEEPAPSPPGGEVFRTDLGREVYGGGGIAPDVVVELEDISEFETFLLTRNAFFRFGIDYYNRHPEIGESWQPPADILEDFERWLLTEELATPERLAEPFAAPKTREYMRLQIHAQVMNSASGQDMVQRILAQGDPQIQRALELFGRAQDLLDRRAALDTEPVQQAQGSGPVQAAGPVP